jgi:alanine dehydrogenase
VAALPTVDLVVKTMQGQPVAVDIIIDEGSILQNSHFGREKNFSDKFSAANFG